MMSRRLLIALALIIGSTLIVLDAKAQDTTSGTNGSTEKKMEIATFGGGCFWCVEAVFENMPGVKDVVSGYTGGSVPKPSYEQVCTGRTGHAEVCQIHFDPSEVSFLRLLEVFMKTHDPTTLNAQGPDHGTQYRSAIFYESQSQKETAEAFIAELNKEKAFRSPIVTEVVPLTEFYAAEDYHQDYYRKNPGAGYCRAVVAPKVAKFKKVLQELEKKEKAEKAKKKKGV